MNGTPRSNASSNVALYPLLQRQSPREIYRLDTIDKNLLAVHGSTDSKFNSKSFNFARSPGVSELFADTPGPVHLQSLKNEVDDPFQFDFTPDNNENTSDSARLTRRARGPTVTMVSISALFNGS